MKRNTEYNPADMCVSEPAAEYLRTPSSSCPVCRRSNVDDEKIARESRRQWVEMMRESCEKALEEYKQGKGISQAEMEKRFEKRIAEA